MQNGENMLDTAIERDTIAVAFVHEALAGFSLDTQQKNAVLNRAGIPPSLLANPHARIAASLYGRLWHRLALAQDDEFFGMDSHPMKSGSFSLLCRGLITTRTLEQALRHALAFLRLVLDDLRGELVREEGLIHLVVKRVEHPAARAPRAFAYGTFLLIVYGLSCWLVGRRIPLLSARFACGAPVFSQEWRVMFSPRLSFDAPETAISFKSHYLDLPNIRDEAALRRFRREAPANLLVKFRTESPFYSRIRHWLKTYPPNEWPEFDAIAARFSLSPSTLRRRLKEEGLSYRDILDELRCDLAISLLSGTSLPVHAIAAELGFAESSTFHRAFRKWTGLKPMAYRTPDGAID